MPVQVSDILLVLIAILFPPAAAAILTGCSCALLISVLLTILGYIPGHLYAFYLIYRKIQADERYGPEGYVYVSQGVYQPIGADQPAPPHSNDVERSGTGAYYNHHQQQQQMPAGPAAGYYQPVAGSQDAPKGPPPAYGAA